MDEPEINQPEKRPSTAPLRCPHLGLFSDPQTLIANADPRNYCHFVFPPASVLISHQETYCLQNSHTRCEVFLQQGLGYFPDILFDNTDSNKRGPKRSRQAKGQDKAAKAAATVAVASAVNESLTPAIIPAPSPTVNQRGTDRTFLGNEIIGARTRNKGGSQSKTRGLWIGVLSLLLIALVISIFGIYSWYGRVQNQLEAERAFGQAMATSAYDSSILAGEARSRSTSQAATVTALAGAFQNQATAQAATIVALTQAVTPAPVFCQGVDSVQYEIVSGPDLIPAVGTTYVDNPPEKLQASWKVKNTSACNWEKFLLWSLGDGRIIIPVIQQGKLLLDPMALNQPDGIAPGETIEVIVEFDAATATEVDREIILMVNDLSLVDRPKLMLEILNWILRVTPTPLPVTATSAPRPTSQSPGQPKPTSPPQPTSPPPRPTDPPYPTRPPAATSTP